MKATFVGLVATVFVVGSVVFLPATATAAGSGPGPAGARYELGGYRLFLECSGTGGPTVILDAGLGADHAEWSAVQPGVARFTSVCGWDRAGLGRSDPQPEWGPVTTESVVTELHTLLQRAGITGPYVLVGHSVGGIDMRLYQHLYPAEVVGLVMAEATPEQQYLTGPTVDRNDGEVMQIGPGARALERSTLPAALPLVVIERAKDTDPVWQAQQAALSVRSANSLLVVGIAATMGWRRNNRAWSLRRSRPSSTLLATGPHSAPAPRRS